MRRRPKKPIMSTIGVIIIGIIALIVITTIAAITIPIVITTTTDITTTQDITIITGTITQDIVIIDIITVRGIIIADIIGTGDNQFQKPPPHSEEPRSGVSKDDSSVHWRRPRPSRRPCRPPRSKDEHWRGRREPDLSLQGADTTNRSRPCPYEWHRPSR